MEVNLINYYDGNEILESATQKKLDKSFAEKVEQRHFNLRNMSIQSYFLRLSTEHKRKYILKLVEQLGSPATLFEIFSIISMGRAKVDMYATVDPETNYVIEKMVLDHDRMLDKKTLEETITTDTEWFCTLEQSQQVNVLMGLLKMSTGNVKKTLYLPLYRLYRCKLAAFSKTHSGSGLKVQPEEIPKLTYNESDLDPKHPASIEVERQRKKWAELILKYKQEVNPLSENPEDEAHDEKEKKGKKAKAVKKKGLGPATFPIQALLYLIGKGDGNYCYIHQLFKHKTLLEILFQPVVDLVEKDTTNPKAVDMIQLLPIWIVKKIFCFLKFKQLIQLRGVNSYWSFVITELLDERRARARLDASLSEMKAKIVPERFEKAMEPLKEKRPDVFRHKVFYTVGAVVNELIPKNLKHLVNESLETAAKREEKNEFDLETGSFVPFPRLIKEDIELYRYKPGFLHDVGVWFDIDGEIERQKSFLSYSLAKTISSLKISVDKKTLSEW